LVLVGGMTIGAIFTLFMVPAIYVLFARDHARQRATEKAIETSAVTLSQPEVIAK
jgi:multidrug efflux pump